MKTKTTKWLKYQAPFLILLVVLLTGCAGAVREHPPVLALSDILGSPAPEVIRNMSEIELAAWQAAAAFSQNMFREVLAQGDENAVVSPLSAYFALAMAALGAGGETLDEFAAVLGRDPWDLAPELASLAVHLMRPAGGTVLNIAGSVWLSDLYTVAPDFDRAMIDYFGAPARARDFTAPATVREINAWISAMTEGLIGNMLEEMNEDAAMYLINTVYLYAKWASSFRPMGEFRSAFFLECGDERIVDFLGARESNYSVNVTDTFEAALLPYNDGKLGFFLVRPTDGTTVRDFAAAHDLNAIFRGMARRPSVTIRMPALEKEFDIEMSGLLQNMGLVSAFCEISADLTGLVQEEVYPPLIISEVHQRVRIRVDKDGTEAAVATVVVPQPASAPPLEPLVLTFNTPYIFVIYDLRTGIPLFMGVVDNPA